MNYLAIFLVLLFSNGPKDTGTLTVTINNIKSVKGTLKIGLFNNGENFLEEGQAYKSISIEVKNSSETITFQDLPKGDYAISLYHDKNSNGKCDRNLIGIPTEQYGFSNNFRPKFSAPTFKDCVFELDSDQTLKIELN